MASAPRPTRLLPCRHRELMRRAQRAGPSVALWLASEPVRAHRRALPALASAQRAERLLARSHLTQRANSPPVDSPRAWLQTLPMPHRLKASISSARWWIRKAAQSLAHWKATRLLSRLSVLALRRSATRSKAGLRTWGRAARLWNPEPLGRSYSFPATATFSVPWHQGSALQGG
jgi:hypothetical protein